jgi:hypothetical protein
MVDLIGTAARNKWSNSYEAFRFVKPDAKGNVDAEDVHMFLVKLGVTDRSRAQQFLDRIGGDRPGGGASHKQFQELLQPYIGLEGTNFNPIRLERGSSWT